MTTGDGWTTAVRDRLAPGRLLPLGTAADGAWLAERAAREALGRAVAGVRDAVPGALRIGAAGPAGDPGPFPVPPGGLPAGPLRIEAEFAAVAGGRSLPETAEEVRALLLAAARELGLAVTEVDLRVTDLLEEAPVPEPAPPPPALTSPATDDPVALAVLRAPGVAAMTDALGPPVHRTPEAVRVECAVSADRPVPETARAAREAAAAAAPEGAAVTVVVTELR
ncbi:hypothetical protein HHL19_05650 [Streptomyces sp. R302]|uniref:hypothetical protein n=1 Tax=unclassified Streptomyces TaxID=2593676 RepID=UPI00145F010D|nr:MULTISPECIES: hypothetical protein [unclassified Streptomyces]NML49834.1 hypothetical protein [Streptomyces sp. R301]NML78161.1 hypothetical protein [Streptomyces sp. R302]